MARFQLIDQLYVHIKGNKQNAYLVLREAKIRLYILPKSFSFLIPKMNKESILNIGMFLTIIKLYSSHLKSP